MATINVDIDLDDFDLDEMKIDFLMNNLDKIKLIQLENLI